MCQEDERAVRKTPETSAVTTKTPLDATQLDRDYDKPTIRILYWNVIRVFEIAHLSCNLCFEHIPEENGYIAVIVTV